MGKTTTSLQSKLLRNPTLMTGICHVDIYRPWNHEAYVTIADAWLRDPSDMVSFIGHTHCLPLWPSG